MWNGFDGNKWGSFNLCIQSHKDTIFQSPSQRFGKHSAIFRGSFSVPADCSEPVDCVQFDPVGGRRSDLPQYRVRGVRFTPACPIPELRCDASGERLYGRPLYFVLLFLKNCFLMFCSISNLDYKV